MINNWDYQRLKLDYSSYTKDNDHPSDIDIFYITEDDTLLLGEIKNESYSRNKWNKQKKILQRVIDNYNKEAFYFFIIHNKYVQNGAEKVDVPNCKIKEYYYKGKWRTPKKEIKVIDILNKYIKKEKSMEIISNKNEMIFRNDYNGKPIYSIGLSKKKQDGTYENGYMTVNFKEGTDIKDKTKIKIKNAWLSFYLKDKKTIPTIFINDYEIVSEINPEHKEMQDITNNEHYKTKSNIENVQITDADLPF